MRNQPAPPRAVYEALTDFDRAAGRKWLRLLDDEQRPRIVSSIPPSRVVWSSVWIKRPDAVVEFDLPAVSGGTGAGGTDLRWRLLVDEPIPDDVLIGHLRKRLNTLINADLRYSFGQ
jgi:hypothetical protein